MLYMLRKSMHFISKVRTFLETKAIFLVIPGVILQLYWIVILFIEWEMKGIIIAIILTVQLKTWHGDWVLFLQW